MARPQKKGLDYFSHDTTASNSREVEYLEAMHGLIGYSIYMKILERIYGHEGYYIHWSEMDQAIFAKRCGVEVDKIQAILETCFEAELFTRWIYEANQVLTSAAIQRRFLQATEKRTGVRIEDKYCADQEPINIYGEETGVSGEETGVSGEESTQSKVKESKEEKIKKEPKNTVGRFTPPTLEEVKTYCEERKNGIDPQYWIDSYTAKDWMIGKNKMKDWKAAIRTWEGRNKTDSKPSDSYPYELAKDPRLP